MEQRKFKILILFLLIISINSYIKNGVRGQLYVCSNIYTLSSCNSNGYCLWDATSGMCQPKTCQQLFDINKNCGGEMFCSWAKQGCNNITQGNTVWLAYWTKSFYNIYTTADASGTAVKISLKIDTTGLGYKTFRFSSDVVQSITGAGNVEYRKSLLSNSNVITNNLFVMVPKAPRNCILMNTAINYNGDNIIMCNSGSNLNTSWTKSLVVSSNIKVSLYNVNSPLNSGNIIKYGYPNGYNLYDVSAYTITRIVIVVDENMTWTPKSVVTFDPSTNNAGSSTVNASTTGTVAAFQSFTVPTKNTVKYVKVGSTVYAIPLDTDNYTQNSIASSTAFDINPLPPAGCIIIFDDTQFKGNQVLVCESRPFQSTAIKSIAISESVDVKLYDKYDYEGTQQGATLTYNSIADSTDTDTTVRLMNLNIKSILLVPN